MDMNKWNDMNKSLRLEKKWRRKSNEDEESWERRKGLTRWMFGGLKAEMQLRIRGWRAVKDLDADARDKDVVKALRREEKRREEMWRSTTKQWIAWCRRQEYAKPVVN